VRGTPEGAASSASAAARTSATVWRRMQVNAPPQVGRRRQGEQSIGS